MPQSAQNAHTFGNAFDIGVWDLHLCLLFLCHFTACFMIGYNTSWVETHQCLTFFYSLPFRNAAAFATMAICLYGHGIYSCQVLTRGDRLGRTAPLLTTAEHGASLKMHFVYRVGWNLQFSQLSMTLG